MPKKCLVTGILHPDPQGGLTALPHKPIARFKGTALHQEMEDRKGQKRGREGGEVRRNHIPLTTNS